jgi:hypothetical protein
LTILAGRSFLITGSGFTPPSRVNFFVARSNSAFNAGPFTPAAESATRITVDVPATTPLGQGFVSVQVVNTGRGSVASNLAYALFEGSPTAGIPSITGINGMGLAPTSRNPNFATDNVETVVRQGAVVTIDGMGFDTTHGVGVDLFCACPGGKVGPFFLNPGNPGLAAGQIKFKLPAAGLPDSPATGPGSFVVSNKGVAGNYARRSNAVSAPIGARISVGSVTQAGSTLTVSGTGFSKLTIINFFNTQGVRVVNLGGLTAGGAAKIHLTFVNDTRFTFRVPAGAMPGPSYVQALNPPFVPFSSSGTGRGGAFTLH